MKGEAASTSSGVDIGPIYLPLPPGCLSLGQSFSIPFPTLGGSFPETGGGSLRSHPYPQFSLFQFIALDAGI